MKRIFLLSILITMLLSFTSYGLEYEPSDYPLGDNVLNYIKENNVDYIYTTMNLYQGGTVPAIYFSNTSKPFTGYENNGQIKFNGGLGGSLFYCQNGQWIKGETGGYPSAPIFGSSTDIKDSNGDVVFFSQPNLVGELIQKGAMSPLEVVKMVVLLGISSIILVLVLSRSVKLSLKAFRTLFHH